MTSLSVEQVRTLDRLATKKYGIPSLILMENAGAGLVQEIEPSLDRQSKQTQVLVVCGGGNNAGDGFVAARRLFQMKHNVSIYLLSDKNKFKGDTLINFNIAEKLKIPIYPFDELKSHLTHKLKNYPLFIIDSILGTGFKNPLKPNLSHAITFINGIKKSHNAKVTVLAVDIPSGLSGDHGPLKNTPAIVADCTVTFVEKKKGLTQPGSHRYVKKITVVDIGIPNQLIQDLQTASN